MRTPIHRAVLSLLPILVLVACASRNEAETEHLNTGGDSPAGIDVQLSDYSIHRVRLDRPFRYKSADGRETDVMEAYLVRLTMKLPRPSGPALELFVGDTRIREYGGWSRGLYFKIYELAELERLDGGEVGWRWPGRERVATGVRMDVQDARTLGLESLPDVLGR